MNKSKKVTKTSFESFNLSNDLLHGIQKKGYTTATDVQNEAIPLILNGRNVVAMAPTGTGKTAAFLIPMFEKLKFHSPEGARALIISPSRDLALQTLKFTTELGKFMNLKAATLLGGSNMDDDFAALHENPDIIIATPARLLHIRVEMGNKFNLKNMEYIVFDEGDRLFEVDLSEQLTEILNCLPVSRQTVIFSATLPGKLAEFAKAGMEDPVLIQTEKNTKISENLQINMLHVTNDNKLAVLLEILSQIVRNKQQVLVFFATKHHIEHVSKVLQNISMEHVIVYSSLDKEARVNNTKKFVKGKSPIMLVTDLAARGIDIPKLPYMINYHFPDKPKLFVHRVGRVARAGEKGTAISLVDNIEIPYLLDTFLFLSKPMKIVDNSPEMCEEVAGTHGLLGSVPSSIITRQQEVINSISEADCDVQSLEKTIKNALAKYTKMKLNASQESGLRAKTLILNTMKDIRIHPMFEYANNMSEKLLQYKESLKTRNITIFETVHGRNPKAIEALAHLRKMCENKQKFRTTLDNNMEKFQPTATQKKLTKSGDNNTNYYIPDLRTTKEAYLEENALKINNFNMNAKEAQMELKNDEVSDNVRPCGAKRQRMTWDRKRKRFVGDASSSSKKIRTESGAIIPESYKTDKYNRWLKQSNAETIQYKNTVDFEDDGGDYDNGDVEESKKRSKSKSNNKSSKGIKVLNKYNSYKNPKRLKEGGMLHGSNEFRQSREKKAEQIAKIMRDKNKKKNFQEHRRKENRKKPSRQ